MPWDLDATDAHVYLAHIRPPGGPLVSRWSGIAALSYDRRAEGAVR